MGELRFTTCPNGIIRKQGNLVLSASVRLKRQRGMYGSRNRFRNLPWSAPHKRRVRDGWNGRCGNGSEGFTPSSPNICINRNMEVTNETEWKNLDAFGPSLYGNGGLQKHVHRLWLLLGHEQHWLRQLLDRLEPEVGLGRIDLLLLMRNINGRRELQNPKLGRKNR